MKHIIYICILFLLPITILKAEVINIDNKELIKLLEKKIPLIDIRLEEEWKQTKIIRNSHLLTYFDIYGNKNPWDISKIVKSKDKPFILICRSGRRSAIAAEELKKEGYKKIYNVKNGILQWINEGNEVVDYTKPISK